MDMSSYSLPISMLRQHQFCPRIPYFVELLGLQPVMPLWVRQGSTHHRRQQMLDRRRNLVRYNLDQGKVHHDVRLNDDQHGIHGICDAVVETDTAVYAVEFKLSGNAVMRNQRIQLIAYGIASEIRFGKPCDRGFVLFGDRGKTIVVDINEQARSDLNNVVEEIRYNLDGAAMPTTPANAAQCGQCEFLNYCNDRE